MTFEETARLLEAEGLRTVTLGDKAAGGCLLIAPDLSARIMAVSMDGAKGENFGFVKPEAIKNRANDRQFNAYGGALRWWAGPEGGQYGVAFPPGTKNFDLGSWYISEEYNGKAFAVAYPQSGAGNSALMGAEFSVQNASGTRFHIGVASRLTVLPNSLDRGKARSPAGRMLSDGSVRHFGYRSEVTFENLSSEPMRGETGLVSIWMLAMYVAGSKTHVIAPFQRQGAGKVVTDTYFSPEGIASNRLIIKERQGFLIFHADAKHRSKIGLSRSRAANTLGSIDLSRNLLTIWRFPIRRTMPYVNSLWEYQKRPYAGDATNSYNDDGKFGNFYELECSSHALALKPGERFMFPLEIHHYRGTRDKLLQIADFLLQRKVSPFFLSSGASS